MKYFRSFRKFKLAHVQAPAAFDEGFRQGEMTGKAAEYQTGFQLGYMKALSDGGQVTDLKAPDPAAWISGVDRR